MTPSAAQAAFREALGAFREAFPSSSALRSAHLVVIPRWGLRRGARQRDVADANPATGEIRLVRRLLEMPDSTIGGVMLHELGHLADPILDAPGAEARADALAWVATGRRIRYDCRLFLQTLSPRAALPQRPEHLHR